MADHVRGNGGRTRVKELENCLKSISHIDSPSVSSTRLGPSAARRLAASSSLSPLLEECQLLLTLSRLLRMTALTEGR